MSAEHDDEEKVGGHREDLSRFPDPPQVADRVSRQGSRGTSRPGRCPARKGRRDRRARPPRWTPTRSARNRSAATPARQGRRRRRCFRSRPVGPAAVRVGVRSSAGRKRRRREQAVITALMGVASTRAAVPATTSVRDDVIGCVGDRREGVGREHSKTGNARQAFVMRQVRRNRLAEEETLQSRGRDGFFSHADAGSLVKRRHAIIAGAVLESRFSIADRATISRCAAACRASASGTSPKRPQP